MSENDLEIIDRMLDKQPDKIVLSNLADQTYVYKKTLVKKFYKNDRMFYQVESFTDKQAFHKNIEYGELRKVILDVFPRYYKQLNAFGDGHNFNYKVTKKGKLLCNISKDQNSDCTGTSEVTGNLGVDKTLGKKVQISGEERTRYHNRKKNYILQEGSVIPPLVDLGIFTKEGRVVRSMYDKYKQINRFIELVDDVVKDYSGDVFNIIDFGCGKSYLTFILYYYLVEIRGINARITGLDLKADVIEKCNATAKKYHYDNLHFELGDINGYKTDKPVDMVVTLHACDTATDYALYNAICWNAGIIMSVPCCQHELNSQIQSDDYSLLTRYGIVKERVSALMTDAIRANVLEYCGYNTQLLEFIDIAHSPKNILIRAVKKGGGSKKSRLEEAERLCNEFHLRQTLMELVKEMDD